MAALASPEQLGTYLGAEIAEDDARAVLLLATVSAAVVQEVGSVADDWTDENVPDVVLGVVLSASSRRWENPSGAADLRTGPFSTTWNESGTFTDDERVVLGRFRAPGVGGLYTIATTRSENDMGDLPDRYLTVTGQTEPIVHTPIDDVNW